VVYNDFTLFLIKSDGTLLWKNMLGIGVIPNFIWANEVAIFFVPPGGESRSVVFDYFNSKPIGSFGYTKEKLEIPMIMTKNDGQFTVKINYMQTIPNQKWQKGAFACEENPTLCYVDTLNNSLWKTSKGLIEQYYYYTNTGKLLFDAFLIIPETKVEGTGFWTFIDEKLQIYKNWFYEDYMEVVQYKMEF